MMEQDKEAVMRALARRAMGYTTEEIVEEYSVDNGKLSLVKRKVASKEYPPDLSAINTLLDLMEDNKNISDMTDEELEKERNRLLQELKKQEQGDQMKMNLEELDGS